MRKLLLSLAASLLSVACAHSGLEKATPAENARVSAPKQVTLTFSEPMELRFSTFKVFPVNVSGDALKVNGAAGALKTKLLMAKNDAAQRADLGVGTKAGTSAVVTLPLKADLKSGAYVVMWKVLSVDTHTTDGYYVFYVR